MSYFNRIEDKQIDIDVNVQETFDFNIDITGEDDLRRYRKSPGGQFSYWKLFLAILCAGIALFVIVVAYIKYEERKQMEATIEMLNQINREINRDIQRIMQPPKPVARPSKATSKPVSGKPISAPTLTPAQEEFYKDKDGVWRNRPSSNITPDVVTTDLFNAINQQLVDGIQPIMQRRTDEARAQAEESQRKYQSMKDHEAWTKRVEDASSYERFDPATAGEIKSEWEYFDDPRSKK